MKKFLVVTTINPKSRGISQFEQMEGWNIIVIGDKKSNAIESTNNLTFLSVEDQTQLGYSLVKLCPYNHYARKNIGYLYAIEKGADVIFDTDDDNIPYGSWKLPEMLCNRKVVSRRKFLNIYKYFTQRHIWPRGFPLDEISQSANGHLVENEMLEVGVWQGLADLDPDVDAIYRLVIGESIKFEQKLPILLNKSTYCPFNSQNTFWSKKTFPLLYLPATTSFRFTDILRGYIAQRLMWEHDLHLGFTEATVYQERNLHNLMKDFKDEVECYLNIKPIVELLDSLVLESNFSNALEDVYTQVIDAGFIDSSEREIVKAWVHDLEQINAVTIGQN